MVDVWANSMACHPRATCHIAGCCHLANLISWSQSYVPHCRVLPAGKFNGMSSQSHISHWRVLPLGEFTVMIPEPHATLQGAVTWWSHCYDRATLQCVIISSAMLKIVYRRILFFLVFLMQFGLWWAAGFISDTLVFIAPHNADINIAVLSVRLSVMFWYYIKTNSLTCHYTFFNICSPIILVFSVLTSLQNSNSVTLYRSIEYRCDS